MEIYEKSERHEHITTAELDQLLANAMARPILEADKLQLRNESILADEKHRKNNDSIDVEESPIEKYVKLPPFWSLRGQRIRWSNPLFK